MQQLLIHIKKDKHGDALVEKLCQRFASTEDVAQWRNIAFCISQLPMSDKGVKKLIEGHPAYKNALEDDETAQTIVGIVAKVKKSASKQESKELADDLENKVMTIISEWKEINGGQMDKPDSHGDEDSAGSSGTESNRLDETEPTNEGDENRNTLNKDSISSPLKVAPNTMELSDTNQDDLIAAVQQLDVDGSTE